MSNASLDKMSCLNIELCDTYVTTAFPLQYFAFLWMEDLGVTIKGGFVVDF